MDVAEFVSRYPSKNTKQNYIRILKSFFEIVGVSQGSYFNSNRDYEKDIWTFFRYKNDKGYAPKTLNSDLGCIKTYLMYNEVEPKSFIWRDMRRLIGPTTMGKTVDAILKQSDLKTILSHTDVRGRALFLTLISSGMRVGEVNKVELRDAHLDEDPVRIIVRRRNTNR